jgi:transposase
MHTIVDLTAYKKRRLRILIKRHRQADVRTRLLIILHLGKGHGPTAVAAFTHVARSTVYRVADRFNAWGLSALAIAG